MDTRACKELADAISDPHTLAAHAVRFSILGSANVLR